MVTCPQIADVLLENEHLVHAKAEAKSPTLHCFNNWVTAAKKSNKCQL